MGGRFIIYVSKQLHRAWEGVVRQCGVRANFSISAMRPPCYALLEEIVILGVIYGSLVWREGGMALILGLALAGTATGHPPSC